eukprot:TRINITY_DN2366_c0_g1_i2.p2 TRINITY_DN2366_c0_g1~~TRINITY_DN2366_c0_g1_i2.p2  ORF type:complete len:149 (-),score=18.71 TRINITY_DN2366_c0_g1_i2:282-728(-)
MVAEPCLPMWWSPSAIKAHSSSYVPCRNLADLQQPICCFQEVLVFVDSLENSAHCTPSPRTHHVSSQACLQSHNLRPIPLAMPLSRCALGPCSTFRPAVHLMLLVGTVGYTMEWFGLGRYHVAHQHHDQEEGLKLLAAERAKHGGGHH